MARKQYQSKPISGETKQAFTAWMHGTPFVALKKKVGRPLMAAFTLLADTTTWKQAKAQRDKQAKAGRKSRAA